MYSFLCVSLKVVYKTFNLNWGGGWKQRCLNCPHLLPGWLLSCLWKSASAFTSGCGSLLFKAVTVLGNIRGWKPLPNKSRQSNRVRVRTEFLLHCKPQESCPVQETYPFAHSPAAPLWFGLCLFPFLLSSVLAIWCCLREPRTFTTPPKPN